MGLSINILTSGFLVTVIIFFVLMGVLFYSAATKMGEVLLAASNRGNDLQQLDSAYNAVRVAFILAFIAAAITLILAILYAGHELVFAPSEFWHLALYLITYILLVISAVYAFIALGRLYNLGIIDRNGADAYIWAGLLMAIFAFIGLTATGSGRLGMNIVRSNVRTRLEQVEANVNEHLPLARAKIDELHAATLAPIVPVVEPVVVGSPAYVPNAMVTSSLATQGISSSLMSQGIGSPVITQYASPNRNCV